MLTLPHADLASAPLTCLCSALGPQLGMPDTSNGLRAICIFQVSTEIHLLKRGILTPQTQTHSDIHNFDKGAEVTQRKKANPSSNDEESEDREEK